MEKNFGRRGSGSDYHYRKNDDKSTMISHLVVDVIKSLLYIRGQLPLPLDEIIKRVVSTNVSPCGIDIYYDDPSDGGVHLQKQIDRPKGAVPQKPISFVSRKQLQDKVTSFNQHLSDLFELLRGGNVQEVVLSLGPSFTIPNEVYQIKLPSLCLRDDCKSSPSKLQQCKQQVLKDLFKRNSFLRTAPSERLVPIYIMLLMSADSELTGMLEYKRHYKIPSSAKTFIVHLNWSCCHNSEEMCESTRICQNDASNANEKDSRIWVKMKSDLKGLSEQVLDL